MHKLNENKTDHKTRFVLGTSCYMFWHHSAVLREFIKNNVQHVRQVPDALNFIIKIKSFKMLKL